MTSIALYTIAAEYRAMVEHLMNTQDDAQTIADTIEAEAYPLEVKAQQVAYAIKTLEANATAIESAIKEMLFRAKLMRNRADNVREYLKTSMEVAGVTLVECPHFSLKIRKNPPSVDVFEPGMIPAEYMKTIEPPPPVPDKLAISNALKGGASIQGAKLVQGTRLEIK